MQSGAGTPLVSPATRVLLKVGIYYAVLVSLGWLVLNELPQTREFDGFDFASIFSGGETVAGKKLVAGPTLDESHKAVAVAAAMIAAMLLSLPVAWIYQLTRAKRGYQQSVVQLMIILPLVVAGVVILVKNSLALAFSLGGIVAAVRFRNSLDDSKDAVYVFLATGVGLASAVDIPVATVISVLFNVAVLALWYTDFGNSPVELEGSIAAKRLKRARDLARTGTFVAQIDKEVLSGMTRDQLEGVAQLAMKRSHNTSSKAETGVESRLRIRTRNPDATRRGMELILGAVTREWRAEAETTDDNGVTTVDYFIRPKKAIQPEELLTLARTAAGSELVEVTIG